jgi:hypothetical protein
MGWLKQQMKQSETPSNPNDTHLQELGFLGKGKGEELAYPDTR